MTREALEAALANWKHAEKNWTNGIIEAAARERLAQLPEKCGTCIATPGTVDVIDGFADCPTCHGSGKVYPPETVEIIGLLTTDPRWSHIESPLLLEFALAVLDALGETE